MSLARHEWINAPVKNHDLVKSAYVVSRLQQVYTSLKLYICKVYLQCNIHAEMCSFVMISTSLHYTNMLNLQWPFCSTSRHRKPTEKHQITRIQFIHDNPFITVLLNRCKEKWTIYVVGCVVGTPSNLVCMLPCRQEFMRAGHKLSKHVKWHRFGCTGQGEECTDTPSLVHHELHTSHNSWESPNMSI